MFVGMPKQARPWHQTGNQSEQPLRIRLLNDRITIAPDASIHASPGLLADCDGISCARCVIGRRVFCKQRVWTSNPNQKVPSDHRHYDASCRFRTRIPNRLHMDCIFTTRYALDNAYCSVSHPVHRLLRVARFFLSKTSETETCAVGCRRDDPAERWRQ